jgi:predicted O-methyltransferase YrrM
LFEQFDRELCADYKGGVFLYAVVRRIRPRTVVETGVAAGVSSYSILQALDDNGQGSLYSIDLPHQNPAENIQLPRGQETGFLVPKSLAHRWSLKLADSKQELPRLLEELETIDLFIHDSLHEYDHMMFEYRQAWRRLKSGGILFSDDVSYNSAFQDFCYENGLQGTIVARTEIGWSVKMGWITKP